MPSWIPLMKQFKITLTLGQFTWMQADEFRQEGFMTHFYLNGAIIASYPTVSIAKIEEC